MTGAVLDPRAADRLAKLLGLLGSNHDGEVLAAARKAHQFIRSAGLSWPDIIRISNVSDRVHLSRNWQAMAQFCRAQGHRLTAREFDFVSNIVLSRRGPSEKQAAWLADIYARVRR